MTRPPADVHALEQRIGYHFRETGNLIAALTHASAVDVSVPRVGERLEFLGDAVLGLVLSDLLVERYPDHDEGQLSRFRATLVSTISFAAKARELQLDRDIVLGRGEEKTGGREKPSILAAVYEAVIAAIFLDSGYEQARHVVAGHFADAVAHVAHVATTDPKTELQELCQQMYRITPVYRVTAERGPDHARQFVVDVVVGTWVVAQGEGASKRSAEQAAARQALQVARRPAADRFA